MNKTTQQLVSKNYTKKSTPNPYRYLKNTTKHRKLNIQKTIIVDNNNDNIPQVGSEEVSIYTDLTSKEKHPNRPSTHEKT